MRIVIVHPDINRLLACKQAFGDDATVLTTNTPRGALRLLRACRPDLVVVEHGELDAGALLTEARRMNPRLGPCMLWTDGGRRLPALRGCTLFVLPARLGPEEVAARCREVLGLPARRQRLVRI